MAGELGADSHQIAGDAEAHPESPCRLTKATHSFPGGSGGKESACNAGRPRFDPWFGKIPWRRKWQPTPVVLPGKSHGRRSLVGYSPWGGKDSDTTEQLALSHIL